MITNLLPDDADLITAYLKGDASAFDEIVTRYYDRMRGMALKILKNPEDAEEIAQDVFINAYKHLDTFRGGCLLSTWLFQICRNLSYNRIHYRRRRKYGDILSLDFPVGEDKDGGFTLGDMIPAPQPTPDNEAGTTDMFNNIGRAMEKLPRNHQEVLTLRIVEHRSYEEIASKINVPVGTVKSRLGRARDALKNRVAKCA